MQSVDSNRIYSNDYVDFIVDFSGNPAVLERYRDSGIIVIDFFNAVIYLPIEQSIDELIELMGYSALPSILGLTSDISQEASGITRLRNIPNLNLRGSGVLIGFADTGIEYTNPVFRHADGTTRIAGIWDQTIISDNTPEDFPFGTEYLREQINEALRSDNPYDLVPTRDENGHGTVLAGIAAGNEDMESGFSGVAPDAELVIVKLKPAKQNLKEFFRVPEDAVAYQENDLMFGIRYLLNFAARVNKPIVLCISTDTSQYAHDGRGTTSGWVSILASIPGQVLLVATGNEGNAQRHYRGVISEERGHDTVELNVGPSENGFSMELWGDAPNTFSIDLKSPSGEYIPRIDIPFREAREFTFIFDPTIVFVYSEIAESQSGSQLIFIRFTKPSPGIWTINVYSRGIFPISFNIWLPMDNFISTDTYFIRPDPLTTLLTIACAKVPIAVTAYNAVDDSLYQNSGRGYTRIGVVKPDIAAPGVNISGPSIDGGFVTVTGTGAAMAHTAGVAAMLLEWGTVRGNYARMGTQDIKVLLMRGAGRREDIQYPNPDWGYGILDVFNAFDRIRVGI